MLAQLWSNSINRAEHWPFSRSGCLFVFTQQLRDISYRWLLTEGHNIKSIMGQVVLEQFISWLLAETSEWIQCPQPATLDKAIQLAEDHMEAYLGQEALFLSLC